MTLSIRRALLSSAAVLTALIAMHAHVAWAYRCTSVGDKDLSQAWNQRCIPYYVSRAGSLIDGEERRRLIAESFAVWARENNPCTDLEFIDSGYTDQTAAFNPMKVSTQQNVVASIESKADLDKFPNAGLLAITLTSFSTETGEIFDADILLNAVDFKFTDVKEDTACIPSQDRYDLRNTLVHEMGHFIGFDHETRADSTMFASAQACETMKRDLSPDDVSGLCHIYAAGQPTRTCQPPATYDIGGIPKGLRAQCERAANDGGGCSSVSVAPASAEKNTLLALLFGTIGLSLYVTRRSRRLERKRPAWPR